MAQIVKYYTPDAAIKAKQLTYWVKEENRETHELKDRELPVWLIKTGKRKNDADVFKPHSAYLAKYLEMQNKCILLRNDGFGDIVRYIYQDGVYKHFADNDTAKILKEYIENEKIYYVNYNTIMEALKLFDISYTPIFHDQMNADEDFINVKNGRLNLKNMQLLPHSPDLLSSIQLPCDWLDYDVPTPEFDKYLHTFCNGDSDVMQFILQYIGAVLSNIKGYRFKKALFLVGSGDCGKSVLLRLLPKLLGRQNMAERSLQHLSERFGATALYQKRCVYCADMKYMKIDDIGLFKSITGGDEVPIEYKNKEPFDYTFNGLLWYSMNDTPKFGGDKGNHVYDRIIIVKCENVIPVEKRDKHLHDKLFEERNGILRKCVLALRQVIENGYKFSIPAVCNANLQDYKIENSPSVEFWTERMRPLEAGEVPTLKTSECYGEFTEIWLKEQGITHSPTLKNFQKEITNYLNVKKWDELVTHTKIGSVIKNFKLYPKTE